MFTYRKPRDSKEAIELVKHSGKDACWDILSEPYGQKYFDLYKPILFIYKHGKLIASANHTFGVVTVLDLQDYDITSKFNTDQLREIDVNLRQLEMFA